MMRYTKNFEARNSSMLLKRIKEWASKNNVKVITVSSGEHDVDKVTATVIYETCKLSFWNKLKRRFYKQ